MNYCNQEWLSENLEWLPPYLDTSTSIFSIVLFDEAVPYMTIPQFEINFPRYHGDLDDVKDIIKKWLLLETTWKLSAMELKNKL